MLPRLNKLSTSNSYFLFGARGAGKTSLLKALFSDNTCYIDLLNLDTEAAYQLDPAQLYRYGTWRAAYSGSSFTIWHLAQGLEFIRQRRPLSLPSGLCE